MLPVNGFMSCGISDQRTPQKYSAMPIGSKI